MNVIDRLHFFPWTNPTANNCNTVFIDGANFKMIEEYWFNFI